LPCSLGRRGTRWINRNSPQDKEFFYGACCVVAKGARVLAGPVQIPDPSHQLLSIFIKYPIFFSTVLM
jgi:hypothetical protein